MSKGRKRTWLSKGTQGHSRWESGSRRGWEGGGKPGQGAQRVPVFYRLKVSYENVYPVLIRSELDNFERVFL